MNLTERRDRKLRQQQAATAAENNAADWGRDYYKMFPNLMLIEVCREAWERFDNAQQNIAFLRGYCEARMHHDNYKRGE